LTINLGVKMHAKGEKEKRERNEETDSNLGKAWYPKT